MSRVEDDRDAERIAQRLIQERQLAEAKGKQRKEGETAFSKLVQQSQTEKGQTQQKQETKQTFAQATLARLMKEAGTKEAGAEMRQQEGANTKQSGLRQDTTRAQGRQEAKSLDERVLLGQSDEARQTSEGRQTESSQGGAASASRRHDEGVSEARTEARHTEGKAESDSEADEKSSLSRSEGRAGQKGSLKADADAGGGQGGGGKDKKEGGGEAAAAAGFRFNPALMAPVPVAKPKPNTGSERMRAIANEIAQKIVERARVGTNGAGQAEFQIDLRSNVLSGLSIKLSAKNGKIQAVFSGSDRDVLKMIEEQKEGLKSALTGRGLKLEDLRFEVRA
ncbi:flagellar hook-length control protein FliK [Stigmatella aurantiaca]|uniref:Conserved uncharacterized protein n=2 Tax=Stigmatella aurantiaca (strain DW4/3-1) TaxID=378806 RepID=E3FSB2_STIAD|nr:flagellar hook-length control protein FliK [Stigmatella aurantiaca]ADO70835.1 conserved uncharacterized protein [Stigmatella aurantiaca DW4/3-1]